MVSFALMELGGDGAVVVVEEMREVVMVGCAILVGERGWGSGVLVAGCLR
jgi:hypothetical protein